MWLLLAPGLLLIALISTWNSWRALPLANTSRQHFDAVLVLGSPCHRDGTPTPEQRERVLAGVRAWQSGVAPVLVLSGGAAHNRWVEAHSMALLAERAGVPASAVIEEGRSYNTVENIANSYAILQAHGWRSVEVVSSWSHLPRAGLILAHFPLQWRTAAAPWPREYRPWSRWIREWPEAGYCLRLRWFGFPHRQALLLPTTSTAPRLPSAQLNP